MPEEENKTVDIDTSGPETEINVPEEKDESVVNTAPETTEQETKKEETVENETTSDEKLEDYSRGVQSRIAKLTRKMREAERREAAAVEYANAVEQKRRIDNERFQKVDSDYTEKLKENVTSAMESAQNELRMAIESQDANLQVTANKKNCSTCVGECKSANEKTTGCTGNTCTIIGWW